MTIRVLLADDQALLRATFRLLLESAQGLEVVAEASDGGEAVRQAREALPDVVLMDIRMPGVDGIEATRRITQDPSCAGVKVLILTTFEDDDLVAAAIRAGASGFLGKGVDPASLLDAIKTVAAGDSLLSPAATTALIARFLSQPDQATARSSPLVASLTDRERELTALVAAGMSNDEIARDLVISTATVKTHVNRAMMKAGARDRAQLVVIAYESGIAELPRPS